jgi:hypothetical protein
MIVLLNVIPILAILLIGLAAFFSIKEMRKRKDSISFIFLIVNGVLLVFMITFFITYVTTSNILQHTPAWVFWSFIILGFIVEVFCLYKKYIPGQIMAAALHLFMVFPTIFSIGIFLLILAIAELTVAIINKRKYRLEN